jgi:ParB-like chromosome segregation protein Spo0J
MFELMREVHRLLLNLLKLAREVEERAMGGSPEEARARAEAKVQKQQQADQQAAEAKAEREAQAQVVDTNTARLKSLRLTNEAADKEAAAQERRGLRSRPNLPRRKRSPHPDGLLSQVCPLARSRHCRRDPVL